MTNDSKKKECHHKYLPPAVADLLASASAVPGFSLQDHAELLEEELKRAPLISGYTQGPTGAAARSM